MAPLGDLPGGIVNSRATAVSADGSVVIGNGTTATGIELLDDGFERPDCK